MIETYGDRSGYGWSLGEVIAAQTMYVPANDIYALGRQRLYLTLAIFSGLFLAAATVINMLLKVRVIVPIKTLASIAIHLKNSQFLDSQTSEARLSTTKRNTCRRFSLKDMLASICWASMDSIPAWRIAVA